MLIDVSINDTTWLKVRAALEDHKRKLLGEIVAQALPDRDRSDKAAQVRLIDTILRAPDVAARAAAQGR